MIIPVLIAAAAFTAWFIWLTGWAALLVPAIFLPVMTAVCLFLRYGFRRHPAMADPRRRVIPAVTARVVPRVAPPPQRVHVTLWEPRPVKGELER